MNIFGSSSAVPFFYYMFTAVSTMFTAVPFFYFIFTAASAMFTVFPFFSYMFTAVSTMFTAVPFFYYMSTAVSAMLCNVSRAQDHDLCTLNTTTNAVQRLYLLICMAFANHQP